ncbi:hypothetical protein HPB48_014163 [Haemaphysalis longicornis]|uniref:Uncharacterized protein n=1 Tax=Haemaphysalis longicornis TaxID=44386 RepID=A0A9J6FJP0_HAELO|nr:hypothetical protein HPB48_014163 [Haemaphysalis longicornis]
MGQGQPEGTTGKSSPLLLAMRTARRNVERRQRRGELRLLVAGAKRRRARVWPGNSPLRPPSCLVSFLGPWKDPASDQELPLLVVKPLTGALNMAAFVAKQMMGSKLNAVKGEGSADTLPPRRARDVYRSACTKEGTQLVVRWCVSSPHGKIARSPPLVVSYACATCCKVNASKEALAEFVISFTLIPATKALDHFSPRRTHPKFQAVSVSANPNVPKNTAQLQSWTPSGARPASLPARSLEVDMQESPQAPPTYDPDSGRTLPTYDPLASDLTIAPQPAHHSPSTTHVPASVSAPRRAIQPKLPMNDYKQQLSELKTLLPQPPTPFVPPSPPANPAMPDNSALAPIFSALDDLKLLFQTNFTALQEEVTSLSGRIKVIEDRNAEKVKRKKHRPPSSTPPPPTTAPLDEAIEEDSDCL